MPTSSGNRYDAVVVSGGGIKGISSLGAAHYLCKHGYLKHAKTFVGTSAGAIVAATLAMHMDPHHVLHHHIVPFTWKHDIDLNLIDKGFGVDTGATLEQWLREVFPDVTFREVLEQYGKTLVITVTNLNKRHAEYFSPTTTPELSVITALHMSCSVPLYFSAIHHDGMLFVDGGICDNFAVEHAFEIGAKRVLGIRFIPKPKPPGHKWTFDAFLGAVVESSLVRRVPQNATIINLECGSSTTPLNFKLSADLKRRLFKEGYEQTGMFMKKHR